MMGQEVEPIVSTLWRILHFLDDEERHWSATCTQACRERSHQVSGSGRSEPHRPSGDDGDDGGGGSDDDDPHHHHGGGSGDDDGMMMMVVAIMMVVMIMMV